ncbi:MAG: hypothetical protein QM608_00575 [Caulobacter sp.]
MGAIGSAVLAGALALSAQGQPVTPVAPAPPPDPAAWWSNEIPRPSSEVDPLAGRRLGRKEQPVPIDNGVDPLLYRLWGLQPLQTQLVRRGELVLEAWARPARGVRQAVIRITVRRDGRAFVQARAGLGCCTPEIGRRVDIDAELPGERIPTFRALAGDPTWSQPRSVIVDFGGGAIEGLCVDGVSWDVTLLVPGQARHLRRACDDAEVGSIADVLSAVVGAAAGRDPLFDAVLPRGGDFSRQAKAYADLLAQGGRLKAGASNRPQPAAVPVDDEDEPDPPADAPDSPVDPGAPPR